MWNTILSFKNFRIYVYHSDFDNSGLMNKIEIWTKFLISPAILSAKKVNHKFGNATKRFLWLLFQKSIRLTTEYNKSSCYCHVLWDTLWINEYIIIYRIKRWINEHIYFKKILVKRQFSLISCFLILLSPRHELILFECTQYMCTSAFLF